MRRRAQAVTEFALVFPVFMACVFLFLFMSTWRYNDDATADVARDAARAGSLVTSAVSQYFATEPIVSLVYPYNICDPFSVTPRGTDAAGTNWIGRTVTRPSGALYSSSEVSAFMARNRLNGCTAGIEVTPGTTNPISRYTYADRASYPYRRLGWDWGILAVSPAYDAIAPLRAAVARAEAMLPARIFLGEVEQARITACYRYTRGDGTLSDCVVTLTNGSTTPVRGPDLLFASSAWLTQAPAPSAISVNIQLMTPRIPALGGILDASPVYWIERRATVFLDRLALPCRAPLLASDLFPWTCGSLY
jgi:Flp pilus assembly protein TadG